MRVVSLVPSITESLIGLGAPPVGCTRFCDQPGIPAVGGTKSPDLDAIAALNPHVVVVNDEENRIEDAEALEEMGIPTRSISPRSVEDVGPTLVELAAVVGVEAPDGLDAESWTRWLADRGAGAHDLRERVPKRVFVAVWPRPWMTCNGATYGSSLLDFLGFENVYAAVPDRYPEVKLAEIRERDPEVVLLPTEPYPFKPDHVERVAEAFPDATVELVDGRDLFWWGTRTPGAVERLERALGKLR